MSGHKRTTITIDQEEYRRLQEVDEKLRLIQKSKIDDQTIHNYVNALQENYHQLVDRQNHYQTWIYGCNDQIRLVENQIHQDLVAQRDEVFTNIDSLSKALWNNVGVILDEQKAEYEYRLNELKEQQESQLILVDQFIQSINNQQESKISIAESWINSTQDILQYIEQFYEHDKFTPGIVDDIYDQLILAKQNLVFGMAESSLTIAQQAYRICSRIRLELEQYQNNWNLAYLANCEMVDRLYGMIDDNKVVPALDVDGNLLDYEADVNYWTDGLLLELKLFLDSIRDWLTTQSSQISTDQLLNFRKEQLEVIENAIQDCRFQARLAVLSSQLRINIADVALTALEQQGFQLQQACYDRHDMRSSYTVTTRHLDGSEVIIKVMPSDQNFMENDLHVLSNDREIRTQHELRSRTEAIRQSLSKHGLELGPIKIDKTPVTPVYTQGIPKGKLTESIDKLAYK